MIARFRSLRRLLLSASAFTLGGLIAAPAWASGSNMPWEQPLQQILDSIQGPVAKIIAVIIIIVTGLSLADIRAYLGYVADQRLVRLGLPKRFGSANPLGFMELQDVQELANFFERTVSAYQSGVGGEVAFDEDF